LDAWLDSLSPPFSEYRLLAQSSRRYRALVAAGGWAPLPSTSLAEGDRGPAVATLRRRLAQEGYRLPATTDEAAFDPGLRTELLAFQQRHELPQTGRLDTETRAA